MRKGQPVDISLTTSSIAYTRFEATYRSASGKTCHFKLLHDFYPPTTLELKLTGESIGPVPAFCNALGYRKQWTSPYDYAATLFMGG
jgi:hypothetical protein